MSDISLELDQRLGEFYAENRVLEAQRLQQRDREPQRSQRGRAGKAAVEDRRAHPWRDVPVHLRSGA